MMNNFSVISPRKLHFEDLKSSMFEMMVYSMLKTSGKYEGFRPYGMKGTDEGVDILCVEKDSQLKCFVQCKCCAALTRSDLLKIVDKIVNGNNDILGNVILVVAACDVRKKAYEDFETYAKEKGFSKAMLIESTDLDIDLHREEYKFIKDRFFGSDIDKEEYARKIMEYAKKGEQLVKEKLLRPIERVTYEIKEHYLEFPSEKFICSEVIIRSIKDKDISLISDNKEMPDTRAKFFLYDIYNDGIQLYVAPWTSETIVINPYGQWLDKKEFEKLDYQGEHMELNVVKIGKIPYSNIVIIDQDGDLNYSCPIIWCNFQGEHGPFVDFCYSYHDEEKRRRICFEKGRKHTLIDRNDYLRLKQKYALQ
ncbi:hypothetical protein [Segatella copri]|uniref:hypothetical protein n=1 Tax=Segatella copri TaxID=165179 RepID=UPI003F8BA61E